MTTTPTTPAVTKVDVTGKYKATRPHARRLRVDLSAFELGANQAEGKHAPLDDQGRRPPRRGDPSARR